MVISRLLQSWITTHSIESGVLEQGNVSGPEDQGLGTTEIDDRGRCGPGPDSHLYSL